MPVRPPSALTMVAVAAFPFALQAQSAADPVQQIGSEDARPIEQISSGSRQILSPLRTDAGRPGATSQLSSGRDSTPPTPQLTSEAGNARGSAQLYTGGRTALPSEALSRPAEGRTSAVAPVSGKDRCDSRAERDPQMARACAAVIERRAADFSRPEAPQLTPEERLLVEQRARNAALSADAPRRLADIEADEDSADTQAVASLVLRNPGQAQQPTEPEQVDPLNGLSEATAAIVNAIVQGAGGQGTTAPPPR